MMTATTWNFAVGTSAQIRADGASDVVSAELAVSAFAILLQLMVVAPKFVVQTVQCWEFGTSLVPSGLYLTKIKN